LGDLRRENNFLKKTIDKLRKEVKGLQDDNKLYSDLVKQRVRVVFPQYDPKNFEKMNRIIDGEALIFCKSTGSWFHWKELYERLVVKYPNIDWNPSTVDRRLQYACNEGLLTRVKPGTYIYNIHRKDFDG